MKKHIFVALFFMLTLTHYQSLYADDINKKPSSHCISIDKEMIRKIITQKIDYLFDWDHQLHDIREISVLKTITISEILSKINTKCYISALEVTQDVDNYLKDKLVQYIKDRAYDEALFEAQDLRRRSDYAKTKTNANIFAQNTAKQIALEARNRCIENNYGSLRDYWATPLKNKIEQLARQEYRQ